MHDIIIIGAGPAGLSAAIYARRAGYSVLVLEELIYGGQITNSPEVENYPAIKKISGFQFATDIYEHATALGAEVVFEGVTKVDFSEKIKRVYCDDKLYEGKTVIIANGAKRRKAGCKGEDEFTGKGVSYCATCDGAFYRGKPTAIIGGGNTALEDAIFLANNCSKVHVIHRRDQFRGSQILVDSLKSRENIEIHYNSVTQEIFGDSHVEGIKLKDTVTGEITDVEVSGVFVAVGTQPSNEIFLQFVELDPNGYIAADESCKTKIDGVFVAGDTRTKTLRQLVTAASDGAQAATNAALYLSSTNF